MKQFKHKYTPAMKQKRIFATDNSYFNHMFKRSIQKELQTWTADSHRKPLILRGARQVGKASVVGQLGREFDNYLSINLEKRDVRLTFETTDNEKELLPLLFLYCNVN